MKTYRKKLPKAGAESIRNSTLIHFIVVTLKRLDDRCNVSTQKWREAILMHLTQGASLENGTPLNDIRMLPRQCVVHS